MLQLMPFGRDHEPIVAEAAGEVFGSRTPTLKAALQFSELFYDQVTLIDAAARPKWRSSATATE